MTKTFVPEKEDIGIFLLEFLEKRGVSLFAECGGNHRCGKCRVKASGGLTEPDGEEKKLLAGELEKGIRLACFARLTGEEITVCEEESGIFALDNIVLPDFELSPLCGGFGAAVDIGTTTVAAALCDLGTGRVVKTLSFENPNRSAGADVMSRLSYIGNDKNCLLKLHKELIGSVNAALSRFGEKISAVSIAGNTVMQHIAADVDPSSIAVYPFSPKSLFGYTVPSSSLGINADGNCSFLPCFSGYVGGDIAAGMCATDFCKEGEMLIDIGTNGEIAFSHGGKITVASAAAGPAFEGASIECGTISRPGAINGMKIENGKVLYTTLSNLPPIGICGSGLIDAAAALLDCGLIDESGYLEKNFYIDKEKNVYISPRDIRQLQLAKAAISAAIYTVSASAGGIEAIKSVRLSGGFGNYLNIKNACRTGLLPREFENRVVLSGNTSLAGAALLLFSASARKYLSEISSRVIPLELSLDSSFSELFIDCMEFPK